MNFLSKLIYYSEAAFQQLVVVGSQIDHELRRRYEVKRRCRRQSIFSLADKIFTW
ncbi:unnamed protein product [Rodentolepis nana]|uniref:Transposase n=1 Tax=Rodentolepis nana TaxID=102285 RepID=A0A0R3SZV0_RODNA|nr:unnamed protein product [Rodentolepis nana]